MLSAACRFTLCFSFTPDLDPASATAQPQPTSMNERTGPETHQWYQGAFATFLARNVNSLKNPNAVVGAPLPVASVVSVLDCEKKQNRF